jgi:glycosyltransferase involved in cell wall biosynthesis
MAFPLGRAWRLGRLMRRLGVDFCHAHLGPACKAVARSRGHRARTLATLHVGYKLHQHGRLHGVICVNQAQMAEAARHPGRVQVIPNWLPQTPPVSRGCALRAELGLRPEQLLVGCVGRLHTSKGQDLLVRAFLQAAPADAALVLVGEGPLLPDLELLAADDRRVHFVGYRHGISDLLAEMDVFVSPSREESFGLAILEAMRAGCPSWPRQRRGRSSCW